MVSQLQTTSALRKLLLGISLYFAYLLGTWLVNDHGWWTLIGRVVLVVGIVGIISLELQTTRLLSPKAFTAPLFGRVCATLAATYLGSARRGDRLGSRIWVITFKQFNLSKPPCYRAASTVCHGDGIGPWVDSRGHQRVNDANYLA